MNKKEVEQGRIRYRVCILKRKIIMLRKDIAMFWPAWDDLQRMDDYSLKLKELKELLD